MNEKEIKICLGAKIKQYRSKLGLTQDELAEKINRTQRQISMIEVGKSFPTPETLANLIKVFGCSIQDLFDFEPIKNIVEFKIELFKIIENLPEEKLKILYQIGKHI